MIGSDLTTDVLVAALRGTEARNAAIANNIANAETPGYKRLDVSFEAALAEAVTHDREATSRDPRLPELPFAAAPSEVSDSTAAVRSVDTTTMRADGSNVDPDNEMAQLSANQLAHQTIAALLDKRLGQFRTAILGR